MQDKPDILPAPRVDTDFNRSLHALVSKQELSQWRNPKRIVRDQLHALRALLSYAQQYSPYYADKLATLNVNELTFEEFQQLPVLSRQELRDARKEIDCSTVPPEHGKTESTMTSGSTGSPVEIQTTEYVSLRWQCNALRDHLWHRRNAALKMGAIRWLPDNKAIAPDGLSFDGWGKPHDQFYETGESCFLNSSSAISDQVDWLHQHNPHYLISHPSNLRELLMQLRDRGISLGNLQQLRTVGEQVSSELRELAREVANVPLVDSYSSQELGYIALQCPWSGYFHVLSESVYVEILDENNLPCETGQIGKVVVTSLTNYATPLIRYEIGDMASFGGICSCGRGLPVIQQLAGRVRNMLRMPDGSSRWPNFGFRKIMQVAPLQQFQIVQTQLDTIEFRSVVRAPLTKDQEESVRQILNDHLGHPFDIIFSYHDEIVRSKSGKYEDFLSLIEDS